MFSNWKNERQISYEDFKVNDNLEESFLAKNEGKIVLGGYLLILLVFLFLL